MLYGIYFQGIFLDLKEKKDSFSINISIIKCTLPSFFIPVLNVAI